MPNLTLKINNCKALRLFISREKNFAAGSLVWQEGGLDFKKNFSARNPAIVDLFDENRHAEAQFEITGSLTKKEGTRDHAGKWFEEIIIDSAKLANAEEPKKWVNPLADEESDEDMPF